MTNVTDQPTTPAPTEPDDLALSMQARLRLDVNSHEKELDISVLTGELAQAREDSRSAQIQISAIMSVALALLIGFTKITIDNKTSLPWFVYLLVPLVPVILISYVVLLGSNASIRTYYARSLELKLIDELPEIQSSKMKIPSWSHFDSQLNGGSNAIGPMAINWFLVYLGILFIVLTQMTYIVIAHLVGWRMQIVGTVVDLLLLAPPTWLTIINLKHGRLQWKLLIPLVSDSLSRTRRNFDRSAAKRDERSFRGFLFLPRYEDLFIKGLFIPGTFLVLGFASRTTMFTHKTILPAVGVWLIFEVVIYQARYLINDVRGRVDDASPSTYKRRFPKSLIGSATEALALRYAFYSLLVRVVVGTALLFAFAPNRSRSWIVCILILVGVVSISLLYEQLRKITDLEFKKASSEGKNVEAGLASRRFSLTTYSIVMCVGMGYALRCLLAFWLLGSASSAGYLLIALYGWSFGAMFVYMTWIIESTRSTANDQLGKSHIRKLGNAYRKRYQKSEFDRDHTVTEESQILSVRQSPFSLLNLFGVISQIAMATELKSLVYRSSDSLEWFVLVLVNIVLMVAVMSLPTRLKSRKFSPPLLALIVSFAATACLLPFSSISWTQRVFAMVAMGCAPTTAFVFRGLNYVDIKDMILNILEEVKSWFSGLPKWFVGDAPVGNSTG